ncbi:DROUGHT SENSITIVE 1 isoform X1 [Carex rostrata]
MAPPKKTKAMGLDYEQQRQENIKRNRERIASILHQKSQLASLLSPPKANKNPINKRTKKPNPPLTTLRRSLRSRGLPPPDSTSTSTRTSPSFPRVPTGQFSFTDAFVDSGSYRPLVETTCWAGERTELRNIKKEVDLSLDARVELRLKKENVRKVVGERIMVVSFLPVLSRSIVISGNKQGYLGIWDADRNREDGEGVSDGLFKFFPHRSPVSGISVHPSSVRKIYSSCYDGDLCLVDMEKEMFEIIHSSDDSIFSLSQSPHDNNSLFLGERGTVKSFDERAGKIIYEWELHEQRVNTIDFHPENSNLIATSSSDNFVRIWDLRCIDKDKPKSIREVSHNRAVHSAYFSPTGNSIVSTSLDDTVRIQSGPQFEYSSIIVHNNQTGRWLSKFRAIWGWNDSYMFIGNMQRAVDVISIEDNITTPLRSEYMTNIPCVFATHPYKEGHLACAGGGKLYLWTKM